jgi:iron uptake system component EfeO
VSRFGRPALVASVALGLVGVLAACSGSAPSAAPATAVPSGVVAVQASDPSGAYTFTPSTLTVPAGRVNFSVRNAGTEEHEFEIFEGETVVDEVEGLVPGLTKSLTVTLDAGSYTFVCKLNGHDQLGMKGTLTVN